MTWHNKIVRVAFAVGVLGAIALAAGANFVDELSAYWYW
jgi:hypothetical protein